MLWMIDILKRINKFFSNKKNNIKPLAVVVIKKVNNISPKNYL